MESQLVVHYAILEKAGITTFLLYSFSVVLSQGEHDQAFNVTALGIQHIEM